MLSIGEMAKLCHTSVQTIRLYDNKGLIKAAFVDPDTHYRYYQSSQIFQFNLVKYLQDTDLSLKDIQTIFADNTLNLIDFWQDQQKIIQQRIKLEQRKLALAYFQQKQLQEIEVMKQHIGKEPYIKQINKQIATISTKQKITPTDIPDQAVAELDRRLIEAKQMPNLEYGFSFMAKNYYQLQDIHYRQIFKELILPLEESADFIVESISGEYLCTNFNWSVTEYHQQLQQLIIKSMQMGITPQLIYEESWPTNYVTTELTNGKNSIAELRLRL